MSLDINQRKYEFTAADGSEKTLTYTLLEAKQGIPLATKLSGVLTVFFEGGAGITALISAITETIDIFELAQTLFQGATIDRGDGNDLPLNVSKYFAGNYGELVDCIFAALQENFGSFFSAKAISLVSIQQPAI